MTEIISKVKSATSDEFSKLAEKILKKPDTLGKSIFSEDDVKKITKSISDSKITDKLKNTIPKNPKTSFCSKVLTKLKNLNICRYLANHPKRVLGTLLTSVITMLIANYIFNQTQYAKNKKISLLSSPLLAVINNSNAENDFDWDKNGKLDEDEKTAFELYKKSMARQQEEKNKTELLKKFDVNKDGKFDDVEKASMEAYYAEVKKTQEELNKKFDLNNDGQIDEQEKASMEAYLKAQKNK